ncbi:MAG: transcriptional repressor [Chloroflexi bacterium]|nr:MAG: transcriptional repressor [Chloroflexota bacterium]HDN80481.1 transcriptional repressor [Chloroflexota bacterium]
MSERPMRDKGLEQVARALRAKGKRLTPQRALIFQIIKESKEHLPADEIYRRAREEKPRISLSTVYRTLGVLKEMGLVRELHLDEEHHHYELVEEEAHYHLICSKCGGIEEFQSDLVSQLFEELSKRHNFEVKKAHIDVIGICKGCREKESQGPH